MGVFHETLKVWVGQFYKFTEKRQVPSENDKKYKHNLLEKITQPSS